MPAITPGIGLFAKLAGAPVPQDHPIDGVDQTDFLLGKNESSNREGILLFNADRLAVVKWRNWKLAFYDEERDWFTPPRSARCSCQHS